MRALGLAVVLLLAAVRSAAAADPGPTPAEVQELARLYVGAVNGDEGVTRYLAHDIEPVPPQVIRNFFDDQRWIGGGGADLVGARLRPGARPIVEIALRNRVYGGIQGVELTLERRGADWRVGYSDLTPAPAWAVPKAAPLTQADLARRVGDLVDRGCAAGLFSGAVLVAAGETALVRRACGEASRRYHAPNTIGTRFNLGSMDKMFTAVAAMQLSEAGKLSLDATLDRYLDDTWLDPATSRRITVWQLLTHTSGLAPDAVSAVARQPRDRFRELADWKPLVHDAKPAFEPGSRFEYSNTGMLLMGAVVARASGEDYHDYVRRHVLEPAGMTATGAYAADDPVEDLAIGYRRVPDSAYGWRENTMIGLLRGIPAGGGYSTVDDLHRFALALQSGKLVSQASLDRLWTDPAHNNYGAGFEVNRGAVGAAVGHSGFFYGVSTRMRIYLDRGYVAVVLANIDRAAPPLLDAIEGELVRAPVPPR